MLLLVAVPVVFDSGAYEPVNVPKHTVLVSGVIVLLSLTAVLSVRDRRMPLWRNGLHWPVVAVMVWAVVTTVAGTSPRYSIIGFRHSLHGLVLALCLGTLLFVVVESITVRHLRMAVSTLYLAAGGVAAAYGLVQLHDRLTSWGGTWDPINWQVGGGLGAGNIWSTFGNPNHLGGFLAALVPLGVALLVVEDRPRWRLLTAIVGAATLVVVVATQSRGAWLAVLAGSGSVALLLWSDLWARRRTVIVMVGVAAVAVVLSAVAVGSAGDAGRQLASSFDPQGRTTTERVEFWRAAWRMAVDRPIVGFGPGAYRVEFPRYQTARYVEEFGAETVPIDAHSAFFSRLAHEGFPGLLLLLALLLLTALRVVGARRHLRRLEQESKPKDRFSVTELRVLVAGLGASAFAWLVQASFNIEQVGLSFLFWVVLALLAVAALDLGVPVSLRPRVLLAISRGPMATPRPGLPSPRTAVPRPGALDGRTVTAVAVAGAVALAGLWWASAPYRAAQRAGQAVGWGERTGSLADADPARQASDEALAQARQAIAAQPWDPEYRVLAGRLHVDRAFLELDDQEKAAPAPPPASFHLRAARQRYLEALRLVPDDAGYLGAYGDLLVEMGRAVPEAFSLGREAIEAYERAIAANPWQARVPVKLAALLRDRGQPERAQAVLEEALARQPHDVEARRALKELRSEAS